LERGIYLLGDPKLLAPGTGAYQHIQMGMQQLSRYYSIKLLMPGESDQPNQTRPVNNNKSTPVKPVKNKWAGILPKKLRGTIKYLYWLIRNNSGFVSLYRAIKKERPDFIYERCCILDFRGVIIARLLHIPHFYENNGILVYQFHENFFSSYIKRFLLYLERWSHRTSDFVFYVGTWGNVFNSSKRNWMNIENGIEDTWLIENKDLKKSIPGHQIQCCVLGHLMKHHNVDILAEALNLQGSDKRIKIYFVGSVDPVVMEALKSTIHRKNIEIDHKGVLNREALLQFLTKMDVGIITGAHAYQSMMKLFDYGAAKCLVIAPDTFNLTYWFATDEVLFFQDKNAEDLARKLAGVIEKPAIIPEYGNKLYNTIQKHFTWNKTFEKKHLEIDRTIAAKKKRG
jgi:glycosyltransferase involved in cell wall biosynthesis